jgi:hypothetical protein
MCFLDVDTNCVLFRTIRQEIERLCDQASSSLHKPPGQRHSLVLAFHQQNHATDSQKSTGKRAIRNVVFDIPAGMNRSNVQDLFTRLKSKCAPNYDSDSYHN